MRIMRRIWRLGKVGKIVALVLGLALVGACFQLAGITPSSEERQQTTAARDVATAQTLANLPATDLPATPRPRPTAAPTATPEPTAEPTAEPTTTPEPTATVMVATRTPRPTLAGVPPVDARTCPDGYPIKGNQSGLAHSPRSGTYDRITPVKCYATMDDAVADGYKAYR